MAVAGVPRVRVARRVSWLWEREGGREGLDKIDTCSSYVYQT